MTRGGGLRARLVLRDSAYALPQDEANQRRCPLKLQPRTLVLILRSPPKAGVSKDGRRETLSNAIALRAGGCQDAQRAAPVVFGSSFCTSAVMSARTASGSLARAPEMIELR
ncbi:hypothetical protein ACVIIV_006597 [Bradyrhizobium sp. USDA 4354]